MMSLRLNPYLVFDGQTREAVAFYEQVFEAQLIGIQTFGEMPGGDEGPHMTDEVKDRILHAMLRVGETDLMFSDTMPGQSHQIGNNISIAIVSSDPARSKKIFDALAAGGNVTMPLQETFWSPAYGHLTDKFGVEWQISTEPAA